MIFLALSYIEWRSVICLQLDCFVGNVCMSDTLFLCFFFLMIRRPPRSTLDRSSAASDVYKRQQGMCLDKGYDYQEVRDILAEFGFTAHIRSRGEEAKELAQEAGKRARPVSYTHLRAHETVLDLVCRLLLEKKNRKRNNKKKKTERTRKRQTHTYTRIDIVCHDIHIHISRYDA
mgnify:CR=1 FL=1